MQQSATSRSMSTDPVARPLPLLRAMVDALDHELLQLRCAAWQSLSKSRRTSASTSSASAIHSASARSSRTARERAEAMGLPRGEIEALFRVLLRASRDHQAALRTELPYETPSLTVAVIGGRGAMGALVARMFGDLGHSVLVADDETELKPGDAAQVADVTVISVPIESHRR